MKLILKSETVRTMLKSKMEEKLARDPGMLDSSYGAREVLRGLPAAEINPDQRRDVQYSGDGAFGWNMRYA